MLKRISPRAVASCLLVAADDAECAAGLLADGVCKDTGAVVEAAAIGLAHAVISLTALQRLDKRFDFGQIRQGMLEVLPAMLLGEVTHQQLRTVAQQLVVLSGAIVDRVKPTPKELVLAKLAEYEATDELPGPTVESTYNKETGVITSTITGAKAPVDPPSSVQVKPRGFA